MNKLFNFLLIAFNHIRYEIYYYLLGLHGVYEDFMYYRQNRCGERSNFGVFLVLRLRYLFQYNWPKFMFI